MNTKKLDLSKKTLDQISKLYSTSKPSNEFEFIIRSAPNTLSIGFNKYYEILKYMKHVSIKDKINIISTTNLDVNYTTKVKDKITNYRITIEKLENINNFLKRKIILGKPNDYIFRVLIELSKKHNFIKIIKKQKDNENTVDINEYNTRVRLSKEENVTNTELEYLSNADNIDLDNIVYRFKQRVSLFIKKDNFVTTSVDLTDVRQSKYINNISHKTSSYELEIDCTKKKDTQDKKYLDQIHQETLILLKILHQTNYIIPNSEIENVINYYYEILNVSENRRSKLNARDPKSLEKVDAVNTLPNRYTVTDKADGERYFLIIYQEKVYLISNNLNVYFTGLSVDKKYNGTVMDGEYIYTKERYLFMVFDCLRKGETDLRNIESFMERLYHADEIINSCFILKGQSGYTPAKPEKEDKKYTIESMINRFNKDLEVNMKSLNNDIPHQKQYPLIRRKMFANIYGISDNEIFKYSSIMWKRYLLDRAIACPYNLDGLVYHPLQQKYITNKKESKYFELKWKPKDHNSIDFYLIFEKNKLTGQDSIYYDNSKDNQFKNQPYKIAYLHIGKVLDGVEKPALFMEKSKRHIAHLFLKDGNVRDENGIIIQNKSVVEFTYKNDFNISKYHRWVVKRIRHDKTEKLNKFKKGFGNFSTVAYKIWKTIINPFSEDDIELMANNKNYSSELDVNNKIVNDQSVVNKETKYYQLTTSLAQPMRKFHNFIKGNLINVYCNDKYYKRKINVLDLACGRGGDINKFFKANVNFYLGVDIDKSGLESPIDGAIRRYQEMKETKKNAPEMVFIHANAGALLAAGDQERALSGITSQNKVLLNKHFIAGKDPRFDVISCQFAVHYLLKDQLTWSNFLTNINNNLKEGGYLLLTTFDADKIDSLFEGEAEKYSARYTDNDGKAVDFFTLKKKYNRNEKLKDPKTKKEYFGLGSAIDLNNILMFQKDVFVTEYLVDKYFLEKELNEKCNMKLVETDLFEAQYYQRKNFFTKYAPKNNKFLSTIADFYDLSNPVNQASVKLTKLNRFYVFQKNKTEKTYKGGSARERSARERNVKEDIGEKNVKKDFICVYKDLPMPETDDILDINTYRKRNYFFKDLDQKDYTFHYAIFNGIKESNFIPKTLSMKEFYKSINHTIFKDQDLTKEKVVSLIKLINIYNEIDGKTINVLNNPNIVQVEKDCNGSNVSFYSIKEDRISTKRQTILVLFDGKSYYLVVKKNKQTIYSNIDKMIRRLVKIADN